MGSRHTGAMTDLVVKWAGLGWVGVGAAATLGNDARAVFRDGLSNPTAADGLTPACACLVQDQGWHNCLSACKCVGIECKAQQSCAVPSTCCKVRSQPSSSRSAPRRQRDRPRFTQDAGLPTHPPAPTPRHCWPDAWLLRCGSQREKRGDRYSCSHNHPTHPAD